MPIPEALRRALFRRSGGQCECDWGGCKQHAPRRRCQNSLCGAELNTLRKLKRGPESLRNVIATCMDCHRTHSGSRG